MAKRTKFPFEILAYDNEQNMWMTWEVGDWESTAETLAYLKATADKPGWYRVVQVKADVKLDVAQVKKVTLTQCQEVEK